MPLSRPCRLWNAWRRGSPLVPRDRRREPAWQPHSSVIIVTGDTRRCTAIGCIPVIRDTWPYRLGTVWKSRVIARRRLAGRSAQFVFLFHSTRRFWYVPVNTPIPSLANPFRASKPLVCLVVSPFELRASVIRHVVVRQNPTENMERVQEECSSITAAITCAFQRG